MSSVDGSPDPVQAQLEAYNRHDLDAFVACYASDVEIRLPDGRVVLQGHDELRARYGELFASHPDVVAEVPTRIRAGGWTVDEERVRMGDQLLHVAVCYLVAGPLISQVVMLRSG